MEMSRREMLIRLLPSAVLLHYIAQYYINKPKEDNYNLDSIVLSREIAEKGFFVSNAKKSKNKSHVIFLPDYFSSYSNLELKIIDSLIEQGFDSVGISGFYGKLSENSEENLEKDIKERFKGSSSIFVNKNNRSKIISHLLQIKIPCYGLEDKEMFIKSIAISAFKRAVDFIEFYKICSDNNPKNYPFFNLSSESVYSLKSDFPDIDFSAYSINDYINQRNKVISQNIENYMESLNSKKGIVIANIQHFSSQYPLHTLVNCNSSIIEKYY